MRRTRSIVPVADEPWGQSILPGAPLHTSIAPPPAVGGPQQVAAPLPPAPAAPVPQPHPFAPQPEYVAAAQPYAAPQPYAPHAQFGGPPQFGGPAQFGGPPQFGAPPQFGGPPQGYAPQGYAPQGYAPQGYAPQPFAPPGGPNGYGPPPSRRVPVAVWVVLGVVGGLMAMGILAAIAIPVFLSQREKPANRTVSIPTTLLGQTQLHTPNLDAAAAQAVTAMRAAKTPWAQESAAYYGTGDLPVFFVAAAKVTVRPTPADTTAFMKSVAASTNVGLSPVGAGPFGGKMECGLTTAADGAQATACYSIDDAAVTMIIVFQSSPDQAALLARQIIGSVEH
jgi:hypothetical protein